MTSHEPHIFFKSLILLVTIVFVSSIILSMGAISARSAQQSYMVVAKKKEDKGLLASTVMQSRRNSDGNTKISIVRDHNNTSDNLSKDLLQSCPDSSKLVKGKCVCPDVLPPQYVANVQVQRTYHQQNVLMVQH